jgi:hypothetical protein
MTMPSARRIENIAVNDALILPYDANPGPDGFFGKDRRALIFILL